MAFWMAFSTTRRSLGSRAKPGRQGTNTASSNGTDGQLDGVGGAGAHPDELPRRVMTTHPAAMDAAYMPTLFAIVRT